MSMGTTNLSEADRADVLSELAARMEGVQERHRADGAGAAREFWAQLGAEGGDECGAEGGAGCGAEGGERRRRGRRRGRAGSAVRGRARPRRDGRQGPWAHVPVGAPIVVDPVDVGWLDVDAFDTGVLDAASVTDPSLEPGFEMRSEPAGARLEALAGMALSGHASDELTWCVEYTARLRAQQDVVLVNVLTELAARGVEAPDGLRPVDWLRSVCPGLSAGAAKEFLVVAEAFGQARWRELRARVTMQHVTVSQAARVVQFQTELAPVADPQELGFVVAELVERAPELDGTAFARLVRAHAEQIRPPRDSEGLDAGRRAARGLWFSAPSGTGMVGMRATLDPEAAAVIKAAIEPLAGPCPSQDEHGGTIEVDPRTPAKRRADALVELVERGVAGAGQVPVADKAKVVVTIDHEALVGVVVGAGLSLTDDVLSASMTRRIACDAQILPMVLGTDSEPLDVGRARRLVTTGMRAFLWQRDGGCTFPGCTAPPGWTDAHHVQPWWTGGDTAVTNLALLCRRHHTHVHRYDLSATVTDQRVIWQV